MPFIPPMMCSRLARLTELRDPQRYIAEPKLDGQRGQLHIDRGRAVHCYSRLGRDLLRHAGMTWLREVSWPVQSAVLDGEACAGDGEEGVQSVLTERTRPDGAVAFLAFDMLQVDGRSVMREPWAHRRERLEDFFEGVRLARVGLVPVSDDAPRLWNTWVGWGGEGIVLKARESIYRPGVRSPAWLKIKPKLTLEAVVTGGSAEPIPWGDWGLAVMLELVYEHPRRREELRIRQAVRVSRDEPFELRAGHRGEVVCWGVMPSGLLRHPKFVRWLT